MNFLAFYSQLSSAERAELADRLGTSVPYLYQIASGRRRAGVKIISRIGPASDYRVRPEEMLAEMCPDTDPNPPETLTPCLATTANTNLTTQPPQISRHNAVSRSVRVESCLTPSKG